MDDGWDCLQQGGEGVGGGWCSEECGRGWGLPESSEVDGLGSGWSFSEEERFFHESTEEEEDETEERRQNQRQAKQNVSVTLTDPDVLNCFICLLPLTIPLMQCDNGHLACSSCCNKIKKKCTICNMPMGYDRCGAIEKVLKSIRISCRNSTYGCRETMIYSKKHEHELACIHAPCSCPYPGCSFMASYKQLYVHYDCKHLGSAKSFCYGRSFTVPVKLGKEFVILQERVEKTLFVLSCGVQSLGTVANITRVAPNSVEKRMPYDLEASKGDSSVVFNSYAESTLRWSKYLPCQSFLLIPSGFADSSGIHHLQVCIMRGWS